MQFLLSALNFIKLPRGNFGASRENVLVWGTISGILLLGAIMLWDGLLFYETVVMGRQPITSGRKAPLLSAAEIDEVLNVLAEREKKFNEILNQP